MPQTHSNIDNHTLSLIVSDREQSVDWASFSTSDWNHFLSIAQKEGLGPLIYWTLSKSGKFSSLPAPVQKALRAMYSGTWMQNKKMIRELEALVATFHQAEIPVVALKGISFVLTIYPDIGLRPMGDLDLLVPKEKLAEAIQIANRAGYEALRPEAHPGLRDLLYHEICLQKTGPQTITLELHHSLVADKSYIYAVPVDWFWSQTELLDPSLHSRLKNLHVLSPEAQILFASAHAILQHGGMSAPMRWFYDLDRMIHFYSERIDWDVLLSQARIFEWSSALDAALAQTMAYFNTPIPDHVRTSLSKQTDRHRPLVERLKKKPATLVLEEHQRISTLTGTARIRLFLALFAPSPAYMRWRYGFKSPWMLPAFYLYRWWGIFKDALRTILSFFQKQPPV